MPMVRVVSAVRVRVNVPIKLTLPPYPRLLYPSDGHPQPTTIGILVVHCTLSVLIVQIDLTSRVL